MNRQEEENPPAGLLHRGIGRVELFDYAPEALVGLKGSLAELAVAGYRRLSLHAPMPRPGDFRYSGIACFFLNEDEERRRISLRMIRQTLELAREWKADHVVSHLTYGPTDSTDSRRARTLAREACGELARLSRSYGIPIHIEYAAYTASFHEPRQFVSTIGEHPELGICIDVGHAFLGSKLRKRSYREDLEILATRVGSVHLWNTKGMEHNRRHGHTPLHPSQLPEEGWIDIESSLEIILAGNPAVPVIFEYPIHTVTREIREGYGWVEKMVQKILRRRRIGGARHEIVQGTAR